ncbi:MULTISPECIES: hypothetical protein [unclassified Paenibacillus]|uniref:hypothetical protein n=1 Tax=unclassified Paenibacillus TaxID=185978 RepID=UPI0036309CF1
MNQLKLTGKDLGDPVKQGATEELSNGYLLTAGGSDIWGMSDQFHFAYTVHKGDFDFTVRSESLSREQIYILKPGLCS